VRVVALGGGVEVGDADDSVNFWWGRVKEKEKEKESEKVSFFLFLWKNFF